MNPNEIYIADNIIAYDYHWQYPAITEKHAFEQAKKFLPRSKDVVFLAFPWATLIDRMQTKSGNHEELLHALQGFSKKVTKYENVVTVCQHIFMLKYQEFFKMAGVTDVFWTHAVIDQKKFDKFPWIQIYPMPLFPVQTPTNDQKQILKRDLLFSFIGAKSKPFYLTKTRNLIIENLAKDPRGYIVGRESWHFNKIVYDFQIKNKVNESKDLIDQTTTNEYKNILQRSVFSLCPSGSGPNSIRLWESIGYGSIPVILADTYLPPGDKELWKLATVSYPETYENIIKIPELLADLNHDQTMIEKKRHALNQLWFKYGPHFFIYDIIAFFIRKQRNQDILPSLSSKERFAEEPTHKPFIMPRKKSITLVFHRFYIYIKRILYSG